jgi:PAS domain S-box-containing protein
MESVMAIDAQTRFHHRLLEREGYHLCYVRLGEQGIEMLDRDLAPLKDTTGLDLEMLARYARRALQDGDEQQFETGAHSVTLAPAPNDSASRALLLCAFRARTPSGDSLPALRSVGSDADVFAEALLEHLPDLMAIADSRGRIRRINTAGLRMLGIDDPEQIVGRSLWDFIHSDTEFEARKQSRELRRSRMIFVEQKLVAPSGRVVPVETITVPVTYDGRPGVLITARDLSGRKAIERALSETQTLFYTMFQSGPTAACLLRLSDGSVIDANEQFCRLAGYACEDLVRTHPDDLELWPQRDLLDLVRREVEVEGTLQNAEILLRSRRGRTHTLLASLQRLDVHGEPCMLFVGADVTERRRVAKAERESRLLLHKVFHASPAGISISRADDDSLIDVNEKWLELTGLMRDEVIGRPTAELFIWARPEQRRAVWKKLESEKMVHDCEIDIRRPDGRMITALASFVMTELHDEAAMLTVLSDITDRKRRTTELEESERRFREMTQAAPVLIWIADTDMAATFFNQHWLEFTGRSMEQELGDGWADGVHPDDYDLFMNAYADAFEKREPFEFEYRLRRHDGDFRWVLDVGRPRFTPEGEFVGYIGSCTDITPLKDAENAVTKDRDTAQEVARLKSAFVMNMTHEVRTPLTVILGFTSMLHQGVQPQYRRFVNVIERSGRRLLLMLDSVLDLAQLESGTIHPERTPFNLTEVATSVVNTFRTAAEEKNLDFDYAAPAQPVYAAFDHRVLTRVLSNVLDNAVKFTDTGGIRVAVERENGEAQVIVSDTGVGIADEFLPYVFDEFSQESTGLERTHQGTGLGLSVSKRLLELMGGHIRVESRKDVGSTFTIVLPSVDTQWPVSGDDT